MGFRVGTAPSMRRLVSLAYKVAGKNISVLIQGKTGTGKEVLARFIHAASGRAGQPFIPINCGALPENLLESELFGHERGAFTGANQTRRGIFELANSGTLLLDEIGDASPQIQVKLLRVLETGEFMRVGGEGHQDRREGDRRDQRRPGRGDPGEELPGGPLLPSQRGPARDTPAELPGRRHPAAGGALRPAAEPRAAALPGTLRLLQEYAWPGNIRELANVMRRAAVICNGDTVPAHLGGTS